MAEHDRLCGAHFWAHPFGANRSGPGARYDWTSRWVKNTLTTLYLLPAVIPVTATAMIWRWIYHPTYGIANQITNALGLGTFGWLQDPQIVKTAIILPGLIGGGLVMLLYLAALYSIPEDIYDAAMLDGCSSLELIQYIKLPFMRQVIFVQALFTIIGTFQMLDMPFVMTGEASPIFRKQLVSISTTHFNKS